MRLYFVICYAMAILAFGLSYAAAYQELPNHPLGALVCGICGTLILFVVPSALQREVELDKRID